MTENVAQHVAEQDRRLLSLLENAEEVCIELGGPAQGAIVSGARGKFDVSVWDPSIRAYVEAEGVEGIHEALQLALTEDVKSVREIAARRREQAAQ